MDSKIILSEILDFYKYKVDNNLCTISEMNDAISALENNIESHGTISDFAKFYGVSESNVRAVIARKLAAKPKRLLLYPFHKFAKIIPERWREK